MDRLKAVVPQAGQKPPILVYLGVLLQRGKLNAAESGELARWGLWGRLWGSGAGEGEGTGCRCPENAGIRGVGNGSVMVAVRVGLGRVAGGGSAGGQGAASCKRCTTFRMGSIKGERVRRHLLCMTPPCHIACARKCSLQRR